MTVLHTGERQYLSARPPTGRSDWTTLPVLKALIGLGVAVALLNLLNLLPCISHCTKEEFGSSATSTLLLCDVLRQTQQTEIAELPPHHHHAAPRTAFEPVLVQLGTIATLVLLVGRLLMSAFPTALRLASAPPTPPPRAA